MKTSFEKIENSRVVLTIEADPDDIEPALAEAKAAGLNIIQEGSEFGLDDSGHYAYLDTEDVIGVAIELIELPERRAPPERIYPPSEKEA